MSQDFELTAQLREDLGTAESRRMRRLEDIMPAVIYGGKQPPQHLSLKHNEIIKHLQNEAFYSHILTINVGGEKEKAVVKAIHRHPSKPKILHMDFQRISAKEKITVTVPLHFKGEDVAPGVKQKGGNISRMLTTVEVSCLPKDLPEYIEVDVTNLDLEQSVHLSEIPLPKDVELVELVRDNDLPVVSIHLPRAAMVEEAAPVEPTETEVITEKKEAAEKPEEK